MHHRYTLMAQSGDSDAPFEPPTLAETLVDDADQTLDLGDAGKLVLAEDGLRIESPEAPSESPFAACCPAAFSPSDSKSRTIPYHLVLYAESSPSHLEIAFASRASKRLIPSTLSFPAPPPLAPSFAAALLTRAYGPALPRKRLKILVNPFGGQGRAQALYNAEIKPILDAARCVLDVETTKAGGHAGVIAAELDIEAYDAVVCCSGDGLPHEVFNGLARRADARRALGRVAVSQMPCGSGNALSWNLNGTGSASEAAVALVKGVRRGVDLASVTQVVGGEVVRSLSFLSQAYGLVADIDLGTEGLRWMGDVRFTLGVLARILARTTYAADVAVGVQVEGKERVREAWEAGLEGKEEEEDGREEEGLPPLRFGTVGDALPTGWTAVSVPELGNFYAGNMPLMSADTTFFHAALPRDGCFDLVTTPGDISRMDALGMMDSVGKGTFFDDKNVEYRKVVGYRLTPRIPSGYISIDGEKFPFVPLQVEVHRGLGTVIGLPGKGYVGVGFAKKE
ncbi:hypothetical protein EJ06DRAFT_492121 [Trichodelitschia bisporula]|uniref:DAGKc domain-containing protein n=1 Tax=Trichodelitschia bisporula TaxID=703511 RepID=A0A6G1HYT0_9PEZI|nr:hypothetical protein EJ06DRAFT_492121 [Trichodelitschia bisporula]